MRDQPAAPFQPPVLAPSSARRVGAMVLRHWYLLRGSWPRLLELAYWPTVNMLLWGFTSQFLSTDSGWLAQAAGVLVAGVLLWDAVVRSQIGFSISFLEELWSRNLGNLFVSPLRPAEWALALAVMAGIRMVLGLSVPVLLAIPVFGFNLAATFGLPLAAFFANLMLMGVSVGLVANAVVLRHGLGAESFAWMAVFVLAPLSAVYYPVTALPDWLEPVALALPSTHVFEGMRAVLLDGTVRWDRLAAALGLNLFYGVLAGLFFARTFRGARERGALLQTGE
ncbi:MAG TPA: ABC transporter permease [Azospirillaceae bacterium]|nr:ABC transporter permease [Azospirillaceae bacterium]